jgi:hypothetical protein
MSTGYDEDKELIRYIGKYLVYLFNEEELSVLESLRFYNKWRELERKDREGALDYYAKWQDDIDKGRELANHFDEAEHMRRVYARVEQERAPSINRCPNCKCIARTPDARQCFWCGIRWEVETGT